ncbi:2-keto-4-pentenoate hydratase [Neolewinella persica]|uniref:2-keto-4-pentenoate hydratase n=1 Tax=Neolewinella persica TaxID=70998 RepID=UPI00036F43D8|nr:fumarylacetoacetate hydrolase family protein [Neolewinella persica]
MAQSIGHLATLLDQAAFSAKAIPQVSLSQEISLVEAYAIQAASLDKRYARGEKATGFKLGFTSKAKMEQMGVHEIIWGRLTDHMEVKPGDVLRKDEFIHPRVEPEIAFLISDRIDRPISLEEAPDFLAGVAGALEVIDSRYENFKFSLEDVIADNCSSAAYVIGDWMPPNTPFGAQGITLKINGEVAQQGNSNAILGNPLASLVEIARILHENGEVIESGAVILAGAATSAVYLQAGDRVEGLFEGLGTVRLTVAEAND